jgi:hypothetical protein
MTEQSYKILVAKRLAIDPNALLMYFETTNYAIATTPDGQQHTFHKTDLDRPRDAKKTVLSNQVNSILVAKTPQKGARSPSAEAPAEGAASIPVATKPVDRQLVKPKSVAKPKAKGGIS